MISFSTWTAQKKWKIGFEILKKKLFCSNVAFMRWSTSLFSCMPTKNNLRWNILSREFAWRTEHVFRLSGREKSFPFKKFLFTMDIMKCVFYLIFVIFHLFSLKSRIFNLAWVVPYTVTEVKKTWNRFLNKFAVNKLHSYYLKNYWRFCTSWISNIWRFPRHKATQ